MATKNQLLQKLIDFLLGKSALNIFGKIFFNRFRAIRFNFLYERDCLPKIFNSLSIFSSRGIFYEYRGGFYRSHEYKPASW